MKRRIYSLAADVLILGVVGAGAFLGQFVAMNFQFGGRDSYAQRLEALEAKQNQLDLSLQKKIGF